MSLYFWTLPFQRNNLPFGDVDSSTHFSIADYMSQTDKPIVELPFYFQNLYYMNANNGKLWYFPQYHTGAALFQIISGNRIVGAYLFFALMSILIIASIFVLIKELFGLWPAAVSAFWLVFSIRDITWYVLGVYPQVASFGMVPLFLYCIYKYVNGFLQGEKNQKFAIMAAIIIVMQLFTHPQAVFISFLAAAIFVIATIIKHRKIPLNFKQAIIPVIIIIVLLVPFLKFFTTETQNIAFEPKEIPSLFSWYGTPEPGIGPDYYSFVMTHGPLLLPLAIIGVILLILRRKNEDLLMLSWLAAFYISTHMSIIGWHRSLRFMEVEAHILVPIAVVGVLRIPSIINMPSQAKNYARMGIIAVLVVAIIIFSAIPAYKFLNGAFQGTQRITQAQLSATEWIKDNTNIQDTIYLMGTSTYAKKKWMRVLSLRQTDFKNDVDTSISPGALNHTYAVFDYSDWIAIYGGLPQELGGLVKDETVYFNQSRLAYSKDNIRVYKIG